MSKVYHNSFFAMGTRLNVVFSNADEELSERLFRMIENEVHRVELKLSYFIPESFVSKINSGAFNYAVILDLEMVEILKQCQNYNRLTFGAFDITMRRLVDFFKHNPEETETDLTSCMQYIQLDDEEKSIRFTDEQTKIDLGGFGKGYALEKVQRLVNDSPIESALISFGESSILAKGKHPSGKAWQVGLNDYINSGQSVYSFELENGSVSTSSNYFLDDSGQLQFKTNVINPITGSIKKEIETVSVKSKSPLEAEILSTAMLSLNDEQTAAIKVGLKEVEIVKISYHNGEASITKF
ncbi:MAG: Membrane-associated lipoprotein involved in thiamine biosynthesi [Stygiobacter sp.]|nr:MAG: Membrane-associated lipoprotein involved in thiamine biosynthesi [Stygiobacter sp.]